MSDDVINDRISSILLCGYSGKEHKMAVKLNDGYKYMINIGCKIFKLLGFQVQETFLAKYENKNKNRIVVCACKDFTNGNTRLCEMKNVFNGFGMIGDYRKKITFEYMNRAFMNFNTNDIPEKEISDFYYDMFIVDALIGNTNRHNRNWGILQSETESKIAPIYDCGSSFTSQMEKDDGGAYSAMCAQSILGNNNGKRIVYSEFFKGELKPEIKNALNRIVPKINISDVSEIISSEVLITDENKNFMISFIKTMYENVLLPASERA